MTTNHFRDSIEYVFGDRNDIKNKSFLGQLMRKRGFFNAENPNRCIRQKQLLLDDAWLYLKHPNVYENVTDFQTVILPKSFKKYQVRDKKTGRIVRWV